MLSQENLGIVLADFRSVVEEPVVKVVEDNTPVPMHRTVGWLENIGLSLAVICSSRDFEVEDDFGLWVARNFPGTVPENSYFVNEIGYTNTIRSLMPEYFVTTDKKIASMVTNLGSGAQAITMETADREGRTIDKYKSWQQIGQQIRSSL